MAQGPGAPSAFSDQALCCLVRTPGPCVPHSLPHLPGGALCLASVRSEAKGAEPPAPGHLPGSVCSLSLEGQPELPWLQWCLCGGLAGTWTQVSPSHQNLMVPDPNPAGGTADVGPGPTFAVFMVFEFIVPFNCAGAEWGCRKQFTALGRAWSGAQPFHLYFVDSVCAGPAAG